MLVFFRRGLSCSPYFVSPCRSDRWLRDRPCTQTWVLFSLVAVQSFVFCFHNRPLAVSFPCSPFRPCAPPAICSPPSVCGEHGELTCCDYCPRVFHEECLVLGSDSQLAAEHQTDDDPWYCPACVQAGQINLVDGVRKRKGLLQSVLLHQICVIRRFGYTCYRVTQAENLGETYAVRLNPRVGACVVELSISLLRIFCFRLRLAY